MFKSVEGQRVERYIAEVFPSIGETGSASTPDGYPVRTVNFGRFTGVDDGDDPIEVVCAKITDSLLGQLQRAFGAKPRTEHFWWREKPCFNVWLDRDGKTCVGMWIRFGLTGWGINQTLEQFLGLPATDSIWSCLDGKVDMGGGQ